METKDFIRLLKKRYKLIIFLTTIAFLLSVLVYTNLFNISTARVTVLIPRSATDSYQFGATEAEKFAFGQQTNITSMRLMNLIYADEMINHINEKFNLFDNYNIRKHSAYSWNEVVKNFQRNASIIRISDETAQIMFKDVNENYAASVANEIAGKLVEMNRAYVINSLKQRNSLYGNVIDGINADIETKIVKMKGVLSNFNAQSNLSERDAEMINLTLENSFSKIGELTSELVKVKQMYIWSHYAIESNFQNNLIVINQAYPVRKHFAFVEVLAVGIVSSLLIASAACLVLYFFFHFKSQLQELLA